MPFYTKKPVTIEARVLTEMNANEIAAWCNGYTDTNDLTAEVTVEIPTLEGIMIARVGDYLIKGVKGEFYPCKPNIFAETYHIAFDDEVSPDRATITIDDLVDHEDGSCTIGITMDQKSMKMFAEVGILKVLTDESKRIIANNDEFDTNVGC
jgi:hypothetical protein